MRPVVVKPPQFSTKMCSICHERKVTHRLTHDFSRQGYCLQCARRKAAQVNKASGSGMSEGEAKAFRDAGIY